MQWGEGMWQFSRDAARSHVHRITRDHTHQTLQREVPWLLILTSGCSMLSIGPVHRSQWEPCRSASLHSFEQ